MCTLLQLLGAEHQQEIFQPTHGRRPDIHVLINKQSGTMPAHCPYGRVNRHKGS